MVDGILPVTTGILMKGTHANYYLDIFL
jgi:hypothetical protein